MIQDTTKGLMIGQGERIANLYVLEGECLNVSAHAPAKSSINVVVDTSLWYNRLGHPSIAKVDSITDVLGISQRNKGKFHCPICPLA